MKAFQCQKCGGQLESIGQDKYRCLCCGREFQEDRLQQELEALSAIISLEKQAKVAHLRQMLYEASHREHIDTEELKQCAFDLREEMPDDFRALFYEAACSKNAKDVVKFLKRFKATEHDDDDNEELVAFMIKSLKPQWISHVANFIESAFNHEGKLPLYTQWINKFEAEAAKINEGIYDVTLPRDVFIAYSSADKDVVFEVADYLEEQGISCFVALRNLQHGVGAVQNYEASLKKAIDACEIFVLISSAHSRSNQCDAFTKEMAYLRDKEMHEAPPQYHRNSYDSLPDKYKKKRVEFVIDEYRNTPFDSVTKQFFAGLTWCRSIEELATRVLLLRDSAAIDDDPVKYCRQCGAECPSDAEKCKKCGSKTFFATKEAYEEYKKQEEELRRQKEELERQKALQEAEMLRRQLEIEREKARAGAKGGAKDTTPTLKRAYLFAENGDFANASTYAEKVLDMDPECAEAYIIKLMVELKCKKPEFLRDAQNEFNKNQNYQMAIRFASPELKARLEQANQAITDRKEEERKAAIYATANKLFSQKKYADAIAEFKKILTYRDASDKIKACEVAIEEQRKTDAYNKAAKLFTQKKFDDAAAEFRKLGDWKDAQAQVQKCLVAKENARKEEIYQDAVDDIHSAEQTLSYKEQTVGYIGKLDRAIKRFEQAIKKLKTISEYKDSAKRIADLEDRIVKCRKEQEDIKMIIARRAAKRRRRRRNFILFVIINLVLACFAVVVALPYLHYQQGNQYLAAGDYQAAYEKYSQPTIFGGAKKQAEILSNVFSIAEGKNINDSIAALLQLGVPVETSLQLEGGQIPATETAQNAVDIIMPMSDVSTETTPTETDADVVYSYTTSSDFTGMPLPEKVGNTLVKWVASSYTYDINEGLKVHLIAVWAQNEYTILFQDAKKYPDTLYVTFNYNYEGSTDTVVALKNNDILAYPEIPTREGYLFGGWYEEATCETLHEFSGELTADMVLYAKWLSLDYTYSYTTSVGSTPDITHVDNDVHYYPFVPLVDQTITIYTTGDRDTYGYLCDAYRTSLHTDDDDGYNYNFHMSYNVSAGQLYYIGVKFYGSYDVYEATLHIDGIAHPTSEEQASCEEQAYVEYVEGESYTEKVFYGQDIEYPVLYKYGYTFVGWYDGNQKVESGVCSFLGNVVLAARFTPQVNTITLNPNGGQVSDTTVYVTYLEDYTLPAPTKTGHTFGGWAVQEDGSSFASTGNWDLLKDFSLIAKWTANSYDVVLDDVKKNNASVTVTFNYNYTGAPTAATVKVSNGQTLDRPANPTRTGYVFTGWYTNSSCTTKYEFNGTIKGDITLYAGWREMTMASPYSEIQLYPSEYASSSDYYSISTNYTNSSAVRHIYLVAEESGTHYIYWKNSSNSSSYGYYLQIYNLTTGTTIRSNSYSGTYSTSFSKYASFSCNKGDIIVISFYRYSTSYASTAYFYFSGFGAPSASTAKVSSAYQYDYDAGATTTKQLTYDSSFTLPVPVRPGYTFGGWYDGVGGTGTQYTLATGSSMNSWQKTETTTLYAKWTPSTYTITLDKQNGTGGSNSVSATFTEALPVGSAPTRTGYIFLGYFDAVTGGNKYYNADMTSAKNWDKTQNTTLYAHWQGVSYTIAYNANGGTGSMANHPMAFGTADNLKANTFTRTGYTFAGWNTAADGSGTSYAAAASVNNLTSTKDAVVTLYAQWTANSYDVTLDDMKATGVTVTFNYNYTGAPAASVVTLPNGQTLSRPTDPTRSDYVFIGWYTSSACTTSTKYNFTGSITADMTLYAGWQQMSMSYVNNEIELNPSQYTSSYYYSHTTSGTSSSYKNHIYLVAEETGTHYIYWKNSSSSSSYGYYLQIYNLTQGTTIRSSSNTYSTSFNSKSFTCNAGDVIVISYYRYSTSYSATAYFYFSGFYAPATSTASAACTDTVSREVSFANNSFELPIPTKTGYTFKGWYDGVGGTGTQYTNEYGQSVKAWDKDADTTLYAKWQANRYTVTFDKQGGTGGYLVAKPFYDKAMPQATAPSKEGYNFLGYFDAPTGGTKYYNANMSSAKAWDKTTDTTLYAQWEIATYTIYLNLNVADTHAQIDVTYNTDWPTLVAGTHKPSKAGHVFMGWYTAMKDGVQYYTADLEKVEGKTTGKYTEKTGFTLYAQWQPVSSTVSFNANDGTGTQAGVTATYGQAMPSLTGGTAPTREGYIFIGYFDAKTGGNKYYNADLSGAKNWDKAVNTTLYAQWQGVPYSIVFNANGGTGTMSNQSMVYGVGATLKSNTFTRTGYTFVGWSTLANGAGTFHDNAASVNNLTTTQNGSVTLYAQWKANSYAVTFDDVKAPGVTVTFNYNYTGSPVSTIVKLVNGNTLARPTTPVRSGYVFTGWYTSSDCITRYDFTGSIVSNVTLYAGWKQQNMSSGLQHTEILPYNYTLSNPYPVSTNNTNSSNKIHLYFVAEETGTHYIYWKNSSSSSSYGYYLQIYNLTTSTTIRSSSSTYSTSFTYNSFTCSKGDIIVISLYRCNTSYSGATAYFYFTGFSAPAASTAKATCEADHIYDASQSVSQNVTYDSTTFTFPAPKRAGYTFDGWYDGVGGTGTKYTDATGKSVKAWDKDEATTFYAKWIPKTYTVTFATQEGTGGSTGVTATYDAAMPTATAPTKTGYTFAGYFDAATGGTKYYNADMTSAKKWDKTQAVTLYAQWTPNTYTITLSLGGGTGTTTLTATYDAEWPELKTAPTRFGYTFLGFYDAATGDNQYYTATLEKVEDKTDGTWTATEGITLYAHWEAIESSITFDANGGTGAHESTDATFNVLMPTLEGSAPTRVGYTFLGYFDAKTGGNKYYNADLTPARTAWNKAANTTLYAQWQGIPYSLVFDANGGTGTMTDQALAYGTPANIKACTFTKTGYTFTGWNTQADGKGTAYAAGAVVNNLTTTADTKITLYAQWKANTYAATLNDIKAPGVTVTFNYNYTGAPTAATVNLTNGDTLSRPTAPTRSGYVFTGWYTSSDCTTRYDFTGSIVSNVTLYAGWKQQNMSSAYQHTQIIPYNYTSSNPYSVSTSNTNSSNKIHLYFVAEKAGTHTISWRNNSSSSSSSYAYYLTIYSLTDNTSIKGSTLVSGNGYSTLSVPLDAGEVVVISIYRYSTSYHSVAYFYFGGFSAPAASTAKAACEADHIYDASQSVSQNVTYDSTTFTFPAPKRAGYTFDGWYDGVGGTGTKYTDAQGKSVKAWDKDEATTFYAKWIPKTYKVTFATQEGTGGSTGVTATYDAAMPTATAPTKTGYTFAGYFDAATGGTKYYNADMTSAKKWDKTQAATLYAQWTPNTYTITLDLDGGTGATSATGTYDAVWPTLTTPPTKTGYVFKGFYDAKTGGTQYYTASLARANAATGTWTKTEGITLYAQWNIGTYIVSFNVAGGTGTLVNVNATFNATLPALTGNTAPTKTGYKFLGFFDAETGGTKYYNADLTAAKTAWDKGANTTLYAQWQGVTYSIAFRISGMTSLEMVYGTAAALPQNAYTKTGYTFGGWKKDENGTEADYTDGETVNNLTTTEGAVVILYPHWTPKTYTVTLSEAGMPTSYTVSFNLNGGSGTVPASQTITSTTGLTYPTPPKRSGYIFGGWYTNASCTGNPYDFSATVTSSVTLYAKWVSYSSSAKPIVYGDNTINIIGGTTDQYFAFVALTTGTITINVGKEAWIGVGSTSTSEPANHAYGTFSCSVTKGNLYYIHLESYKCNTTSSYIGSTYLNITGSITPTAGGKSETYTAVNTQVVYGSTNYSFGVPTRTGYTFGGWYDGVGGTGTKYTGADGKAWQNKAWDKAENVTLYAKWIAN